MEGHKTILNTTKDKMPVIYSLATLVTNIIEQGDPEDNKEMFQESKSSEVSVLLSQYVF